MYPLVHLPLIWRYRPFPSTTWAPTFSPESILISFQANKVPFPTSVTFEVSITIAVLWCSDCLLCYFTPVVSEDPTVLDIISSFGKHMCNIPFTLWLHQNLFLHAPFNGHMGCALIWTIMSTDALNILEPVVGRLETFISVKHLPRSEIAVFRGRDACLTRVGLLSIDPKCSHHLRHG